MSTAARAYITATVAATTPAPGIARAGRFRPADSGGTMGGGRDDLELLAGQTRVYELAGGQLRKVALGGGASPSAWSEVVPVRVRYDAPGQHDRAAMVRVMHADMVAIVRALYSGGWAAVAGLAVLQAAPADSIERFEDPEDGLGGYVATVDVTISYDV